MMKPANYTTVMAKTPTVALFNTEIRGIQHHYTQATSH